MSNPSSTKLAQADRDLFARLQLTPAEESETTFYVEKAQLSSALHGLCAAEVPFDFLVDLFGIDTGEEIEAVYLLRSFSRNQDIVIKVNHAYGATLESIGDIYPAAFMPERELCELFGLKLAKHPNPKRLLTTDGCPPFLLKETKTRSAEEVRNREDQVISEEELERYAGSIAAEGDCPSPVLVNPETRETTPLHDEEMSIKASPESDGIATEHMILNMGPQHPSTHGVLHLQLQLDGELIIQGEAIIGQLHRGIEKLAEGQKYAALGTLLDRGDYISGIHGELAVALAAENLLEVEVPRRAQWIRSLMSEINRIASHITWMGPCALDAGMMGLFLYMFKDREDLLDILEDISGQRMMFNYIRPGGVLRDITPTSVEKIKAFASTFSKRMDEHEEYVLGNEIFLSRARNVGVISPEMALAHSLTGANLRASGGTWDVRRDRPYAAYQELDFEVPTADEGDVLARFRVRIAEMRQSLRIIEQCIEGMPEGEVMAKLPKVLRVPAGESYASVESPRGEMGIYLVSRGDDKPYRMRNRPPALFALGAGEAMLSNILLADAVLSLGSLDFVLGEIDR